MSEARAAESPISQDALRAEALRRGLITPSPPIATPQTRAPSGDLFLEAQRRGLVPEGPPRESAGQAFGELRHATLQGAGADLLRGGREIVQEAGNLVGNFFKALLPTETGARAGGDAVRQLGDIGTFVSGGLINPLLPQQTTGLARGINVTRPRVAEVPRPGTALPPPRTEVPGPAPTPDVPYPQGRRGTVEVPQGIQPPAPLVGRPGAQQSTLRMGDPQRLALPAPTVQTARAPAIETGVGRPSPVYPGGGSIKYTPPPGSGQIPGTPGGTMRIYPPGAPPSISPGISFTGTPGRTAAEVAGARAGRDLPPRAPGTEGRAPLAPERQARQQPAQPSIIPEGAERGRPSQLASALASNDASFPSRALTRQFRTIAGRGALPRSGRQLDLQDQQITTAVDTLIEGKDRVQFTDPRDPTGNTLLSSGRVPQNLDQFVQGIDHLKTEIFKEYDQLARGQGARVDLTPTIAKLRELAATPTSEDFTPNVARAALDMADRLSIRGSYSPLEAQNAIQTMNAQLKSFLSGRTTTQEVFSNPTLTNQVRDTLLGSLNNTMNTALGDPRYQVLRMRYGALSSIESNVSNALARELAKKPGLFQRGFTAVELYGLLHGIFIDHRAFGAVAAAEASRQITRYLYNPNRAVASMFNSRAREIAPRDPYLSERLSAGTGRALSEYQQRQTDRAIMNPYAGPAGL